jgi:hypothetical protein
MQRIHPIQRAPLDGDTHDRNAGHRCDHPWQMRSAACARDDNPQPARPCTTRIRDQPVRRSVCRNDRELVRDVKAVEDARGREERGEVRVGAHDDAYDRVGTRVAAAWDWRGWGMGVDF